MVRANRSGCSARPGSLPPPAAPHHLGKQARRPAHTRVKSLPKQSRLIRGEHPHQRHLGEVEPLGHHLGAHHDVDISRRQSRRTSASWANRDMVVSTSIRRMRACGKERAAAPPRAVWVPLPVQLHQRAAAVWTALVRDGLGVAAVVAHQPVRSAR